MSVIRVATENPENEQWRILSRFSYPANIDKYLRSRGFQDVADETTEFVAGCFRQGESYFKVANNSPLDISPLLLYYGAANLLIGTYSMLTNARPPIEHHGMILLPGKAKRIADVCLLPRYPSKGALQQFSNVFSRQCRLTNGVSWTMGEILGSIPDLKQDFESHYPNLPPYTVPIEVVHTRRRSLERIPAAELARYAKPEDALELVSELSEAYLPPQYKSGYVILYRLMEGKEIGTYSISGRKYLQIAHMKNGQLLNPSQVVLMFMGLFILGFLTRYRPEFWNPFVRSDITGERLIIEKFLSVSQRYFPNLVINFIYGNRVQFVNETEGILDLTSTLLEDDLKKMIRDMQERGEIR